MFPNLCSQELEMSDLELLTEGKEARATKIGMNQEQYLHVLKNMKKEQIESTADNKVDFQAQLNSFTKNIEIQLPYTMMQVNDVMYIDQFSLITFEYICYQTDVMYHYL